MMVEGVGLKAPAPVEIQLDRTTVIRCADYAESESRQKQYRRQSGWRGGLIPIGGTAAGISVSRGAYPTFLGKLGECATYGFLSRSFGPFLFQPDFTLREGGDGGRDLVGCGVVLQIKTARRDRGDTLIRRINERRQLVPIYAHESTANILVSTYCRSLEPDVRVCLSGWLFMREARTVATLLRTPITELSHWNLRVAHNALLPMAALVRELRSRQGEQCHAV